MKSEIRICIIEDDPIIQMGLKQLMTSNGWNATECAMSYKDAITVIEKNQPHIVLADYNIFGDKTGLDVIRYFDNRSFETIFITSSTNSDLLEFIYNNEDTHYFPKPFENSEIVKKIGEVLSKISSNQ